MICRQWNVGNGTFRNKTKALNRLCSSKKKLGNFYFKNLYRQMGHGQQAESATLENATATNYLEKMLHSLQCLSPAPWEPKQSCQKDYVPYLQSPEQTCIPELTKPDHDLRDTGAGNYRAANKQKPGLQATRCSNQGHSADITFDLLVLSVLN